MPQCVLSSTWVSGGDDCSKEQAVRVVELISQLTYGLHQLHHAVHQIPVGVRGQGSGGQRVLMEGRCLTKTKVKTANRSTVLILPITFIFHNEI